MEWTEEVAGAGHCSNVCGEDCSTRDTDMCDEVDGEGHLLNLAKEWGYEPLLPTNLPSFPPLSPALYCLVGLAILLSGLLGALSNGFLLTIHLRLKAHLLDPTGILLANFLFANFAMSALQSPFSSTSSFAGRWLFGDLGCQLYATVGFFLGIGITFSMGLLILDRYLQLVVLYRPRRERLSYWIILMATWHSILLFVGPPLLDVFGRYGPEPCGTMCTLDYWHGNFRNYHAYVYYLITFAFGLPMGAMLFMLVRSYRRINEPQIRKYWTAQQMEHQTALVQMCGQLFLAQLVCWSPYAVLVVWTVVFPPTSLGVSWTLVPPLMCKLAPFVNAAIVWQTVPRVRAAARYLRGAPSAAVPAELGDMGGRAVVVGAGGEADSSAEAETRPLTPATGGSTKKSAD